MDNKKFGNFITQLRKENNMTQKELADCLHLTDKAISKWERGKSFPDISMLKPLSHVLKVSIIELLNGQKEDVKQMDIETTVLKILEQKEKEKKKKIRKIIKESIISIIFIILIFSIILFSKEELHTCNPIRAMMGYLQITKMQKEYVEVGNIPTKTIYAGESFSIESYMQEKGYTKLPEFTIKSGDDLYRKENECIFVESWHRRGITIYEFSKPKPYTQEMEEKRIEEETEIKIPTINTINITNQIISILP